MNLHFLNIRNDLWATYIIGVIDVAESVQEASLVSQKFGVLDQLPVEFDV